MSRIRVKGNARLNTFTNELMAVQENDHILKIGFGPVNLLYEMAKQIETGLIEGIDFSTTMTPMARRRNKTHIADG